jgi:hypothetical protein
MVRTKKHWTGRWWWLYLGLLSLYLVSWGQKRFTQQKEGSLGWAWTTDPTISTCALTSKSSKSTERVRQALCPYSPFHSQKALKVATPTTKPEVTLVQLLYRTHRHIVGRRQLLATNCCPSPSGRWPPHPLLGFRVPSDLHVIGLRMTIHRASEDLTSPSSPLWQLQVYQFLLEGVCSCSGCLNCNTFHCREYILILQTLPKKQSGQVLIPWGWRKTKDFKYEHQHSNGQRTFMESKSCVFP